LGGYVTAGLILSTSAALVTTVYATASCRFVVVTFTSSQGSFEDYFDSLSDSNGNNPMTYRTAVGLYQWLRPFDLSDWTSGTCTGYQETMIDSFTNNLFDVSRTMAVFAILVAVFQFCWMFLSSCLSMNRLQCFLFLFLSFLGAMCTGLTFLFRRSAICTTEFDAVDCQIDQGGLVMIAAILLWVLTLAVSVYYVYPTVMAVSSANSIDFELHKTRTEQDKMKLALQREQQMQRRLKRSQQPNEIFISSDSKNKTSLPKSSSKQQILPEESNQIRASYSFDSLQSWARPIPKRRERSASVEPQKIKSTAIPLSRDKMSPPQTSQTSRTAPPLTSSKASSTSSKPKVQSDFALAESTATSKPTTYSRLEPETPTVVNGSDIEQGKLYSPAIQEEDAVASSPKKSALDIYIAERLDRIEMLTK
jgi:hypothetical protein